MSEMFAKLNLSVDIFFFCAWSLKMFVSFVGLKEEKKKGRNPVCEKEGEKKNKRKRKS